MHNELIKILSINPKSNFLTSFIFLPKEKKEAMHRIYKFCRYTDDITDADYISHERKSELLQIWKNEFEKSLSSNSEYKVLNDVSEVITKFKIPVRLFYDLIEGMEMDIKMKKYNSFDELATYCYRVASTVGLMTIQIFGEVNKCSEEYAKNLGIALQLTNILRDIKEDASNGRIYLPTEELNNFSYSEHDIKKNIYNEHFIDLMKFQVSRAETFFNSADSYFNKCGQKSLISARIMQKYYRKLLEKIKLINYDVYSNRIKISGLRKVMVAAGVWTKYSLKSK